MPYPMVSVGNSIRINNAWITTVPDYSNDLLFKTESTLAVWPPSGKLTYTNLGAEITWILLNSSDIEVERQYGVIPSFDLTLLSGEKKIYMRYSGDWSELKSLICAECELSGIDISPLSGITKLYCNDNSLDTLDVSSNTILAELFCYNNNIATLDMTTNTVLATLKSSDNVLTALDLTYNTNLGYIDCSSNSISAANIDAIIDDVQAYETFYGRLIYGQGTPPSRTSASDANVGLLEFREWTIVESLE